MAALVAAMVIQWTSQAKASGAPEPVASGPAASEPEPAPPGMSVVEAAHWHMVWHDEFDGDKLDESKWGYRQIGPRESSMIAKDCVSLDGHGMLHLWVKEKDGVLQNGMIGTQKKFEAKFGILAARMKFPRQQGQHGAFWMKPGIVEKNSENPAAGACEIDIVEWFGADRKDSATASNVYWGGDDGKKNRIGKMADLHEVLKPGELTSDAFHVFSVEWSPKGYTFRVDGHETLRVTEGVSQQPQYLILSLLTADWEAPRLDHSQLPNCMDVDWVRVWQAEP